MGTCPLTGSATGSAALGCAYPASTPDNPGGGAIRFFEDPFTRAIDRILIEELTATASASGARDS
jgi:hypothetical protein